MQERGKKREGRKEKKLEESEENEILAKRIAK